MHKIAVVIPAYKCQRQILGVIAKINRLVDSIYVVDDFCPDQTGAYVSANCTDPRVIVIRHDINTGVGGAVITGFKQARSDGATILVKIDGDGQMDPTLLYQFISPILAGRADYTKGNRFYDIDGVRQMPRVRLIGNAALSFLSKLSSGYWDVFDPTNGYVAIHGAVLDLLPLEKISKRYFFESDMLFRLNLIRAVIHDVPMKAVYGDEVSNLSVSKALREFAVRHIVNFSKRIFYSYFLRNFSVASLEMILGTLLVTFGTIFGAYSWWHFAQLNSNTPAGTVMLAVVPLLIGIQFLLNCLNFDIASVPRVPLSLDLSASNNSLLESLSGNITRKAYNK